VRPTDILSSQLEMVHTFEGEENPTTKLLQLMVAAMLMNVQEGENGFDKSSLSKKFEDPMVQKIPAVVSHMARNAIAIDVTADMMEVVTWVAEDMADDEEFLMDLAPAAWGMVHLDRPLVMQETEDWAIHVNWLLWSPDYNRRHRSVACFGFTDMRHPDTQSLKSALINETPGLRWVFTFMAIRADGDLVQPMDWGVPLSRPHDMRDERTNEVIFHMTEARENAENTLVSFTGDHGPNMMRWLYALWVVMGQEIAHIQEEHPDRSTKRRLERMKIPPQVSVITLRRPANPHQHADGESGVQWQHRWMVRGHPRWQACGPGRSERKLIWVNPFWKGPEDAPIKQTSKVYRVAR
jgi:hypothetical protein